MFIMAAVGAAVLAMVSWAALREAQRLPGAFPPGGQVSVPADHELRRTARSPVARVPEPSPWRVQVTGDAAAADADNAEALAAAAALWHLLVDDERR